MTNNLLCWDRLRLVIERSGMTVNSFARHIGLARSEALYQIKRGNNGISANLVDRIVAKFPEVNRVWLLTGYGSMFSDGVSDMQVPFYNCDLSQITEVEEFVPESYMFVPQINSADLAICYYGDDMAPSIPSGTILFLTRIDPATLTYGNEYVVVGRGFVVLRKVRRTNDNAVLRLVAADPEQYDDVEIYRNMILAMYAVKAKLIIKN